METEGIVISSTEYKDNSHIVEILTNTNGLITVSVKTGKKTCVRMAHIQPLTHLYIDLDIRPNRQINKLYKCTLAKPDTTDTNFDPIKGTISIFIADILRSVLKYAVADNTLCQFVYSSLETFDTLRKGNANFHLIFLIKLSKHIGFFPNLSNFMPNSFFDLYNGIFVQSEPAHKYYLSIKQTIAFANLMRAEYDTMHLFVLTKQERNEILQHIMTYYSLHLPGFIPPKSIKVLQEIWD